METKIAALKRLLTYKCTDSCHLAACRGRFNSKTFSLTYQQRLSFIFVPSPITLTEDVHLIASPSSSAAPWLERANIKQPTVNDGSNKLRGRICTVISTSTHHWNLWVQWGQLLKMSVPLSIFIRSRSRPPHPMLCHSFVSFAHHSCCVLMFGVELSKGRWGFFDRHTVSVSLLLLPARPRSLFVHRCCP